jgi:antitoxin (DNA-binding transcriptional repressor) of toxin-antitoxin stability system
MHESIEVKQLRSRLGSYLNQVEEGLTLVVTRQGQAIAELRPYGLEQAGQDVQNGARQEPSREPQDEAVPMIEGMSALGLTSYVCQIGQPSHIAAQDEEGEEAQKDISREQAMPELPAQESQPEQTMQTEMAAAVGVEVESAPAVSPPLAKPAKRTRASRSRNTQTVASPKRRQSRGTSARKKSS